MQLVARGKRVDLFPYLLILPAILLVIGVLGYSVIYGVGLSFFQYDLSVIGRPFVGFSNYADLFTNPRFHSSLLRSIMYVAASVGLAMTLSIGLAMALSRLDRYSAGVKAVALIPYLVSPVATATIFRFLFSGDAGLINMLLDLGGFDRILFLSNQSWAMFVAIVSNVWFNSPFAVLIILAGIESIDRELYDSAAVDGASGLRVLFGITIPLLYPMIAITLTWLTLVSFNMFGIILALTGGGPRRATELLVIYMYNVGFRELNFSMGSTVMVVIVAFNLAASVFFLRVFRERW